MLGGVNMRVAQIYLKNIKNQKNLGGGVVISQLGGLYPPRGV